MIEVANITISGSIPPRITVSGGDELVVTMPVPAPIKATVSQVGMSAYEVWLANGNTGTVAQYLAWLRLNDIDFVAQQAMPQYALVTAGGVLADSSNIYQRDTIIGFATTAAAITTAAKAQCICEITNSAWEWTPGTVLYVGSAGAITSTAPTSGYVQQVGIAVNATTISIQLKQSILL